MRQSVTVINRRYSTEYSGDYDLACNGARRVPATVPAGYPQRCLPGARSGACRVPAAVPARRAHRWPRGCGAPMAPEPNGGQIADPDRPAEP
jgi:hypothetical protein